MTAANVILIDSAGLRSLGRELGAGVDTALEMRDRLCVEECSMLPSSSSGLADELLQDARQRLHGLAGAYSTTAAALVMRADEVDTAQARWWQVAPDGFTCGVVLPDGGYAQVPFGTFAGTGSTEGQTAISAAWGQGLTGFEPSSGSFDAGQGQSSSIGYINLTGPYSEPANPSDSTASINLTSSIDPLPDSSSSIGYINLTGPYSQPSDPSSSTAYISLSGPSVPTSDPSNSVGYINLAGPLDQPSDPSSSTAYINVTIPGSNVGSVGSAAASLEGIVADRWAQIDNELRDLSPNIGAVDPFGVQMLIHNTLFE
jgi:hypothetical protein